MSRPHVRHWWEPLDLAGLEQEFGPSIDGIDPTLVYVVTVPVDTGTAPIGMAPIGMVQTYLVSDTPEYEAAVGVADAAGIDLLIGESEFVGIGLGKAIIASFLSEIGWPAFPGVRRYMAGPSVRNIRSRRTFESVGFVYQGLAEVPGEPDLEAIMVLERPSTN